MFNFQWGKTLRDGSDHLITVPYEDSCVATCPVRAVGQFVEVGNHAGWDMSKGHLSYVPFNLPTRRNGDKRLKSYLSKADDSYSEQVR